MKANFANLVPILVTLSISALVCLPAFSATDLAKVNGTSISLEEFNQKYKNNLKFFPAKPPTKKEVLDDLIKRELILQEAKSAGLEKDAEVVDRINNVLYQSMIEKQLSKKFETLHVQDNEAKAFYQKQPLIRTSHIFIAVASNAKPSDIQKAKERIQTIYDQQVKPAKLSFAEVAQRFSEGGAAPMGGDLDFQGKDQLDPSYYDAALALKSPGKVSSIVQTHFGFHIIKLTAIKSWEDTDKGRVKQWLIEAKRKELFNDYVKGLTKKASITIKNELLTN